MVKTLLSMEVLAWLTHDKMLGATSIEETSCGEYR